MSLDINSPFYFNIASVCVRGFYHEKNSLPLQDSLHVVEEGSRTNFVIALADGHGHQRHFRSSKGARLAVEISTNILLRSKEDILSIGDLGQIKDFFQKKIILDIWKTWWNEVEEDLNQHPLTEAEKDLAEERDIPQIYYGSTLLCAYALLNKLIVFQIGDGDILAAYAGGIIRNVLDADPFLVANTTTSLCQQNALSHFRLKVLDLSEEDLLMLFLATDGFSNAQTFDNWQESVGRDILNLKLKNGFEWIAHELPRWAAQCASDLGSGDDTTIAIVFREKGRNVLDSTKKKEIPVQSISLLEKTLQ